jgi:predicted aldo/keto reductase-like oxidoreductase
VTVTERNASRARSPRRLSGWILAAAWAIAIALAWLGYGSYLGILVEGNDRSLIPRGSLVLPSLALVATLVLTVVWARGWRRGGVEASPGLSRRRFLLGTVVSLGGLAASFGAAVWRNRRWKTVTLDHIFLNEAPRKAPGPRAEWEGSRVREYRRLGRTDARVSDISLGSTRIRADRGGEELARAAIDRGVNYFDTAPDYAEAGSELLLGRAMKGRRDQMFVATKFCTPHGDLPAGSSVAQYMRAVEESLKRLQTDHVDLVHIHSCNTLARLLDPNVHEAFERLKEQGKARFLGFSSHTPDLERMANTAIDDGRFDVMMLAYHHGAWPNLAAIIDRAAAKDVAVVAMKTLKGAKHRGLLDFRDEADSYTQAAFKWVLDNPSVSCLVVSFFEPQHLDEYLYASGKRPTSSDYALLEKYDRLIAGRHCFQHCGACLAACPENLAIDDVLRYRMYFEDYGDEKEAMRLYARLDKRADVCTGCSGPCLGSCPHGVPIPTRTRGAHRLLSLETT